MPSEVRQRLERVMDITIVQYYYLILDADLFYCAWYFKADMNERVWMNVALYYLRLSIPQNRSLKPHCPMEPGSGGIDLTKLIRSCLNLK